MIRSSAYLVTQAGYVTQDDLNAIDEEEELLPLGDTLHFQVNHARGCCVHMVHFFCNTRRILEAHGSLC